MPGAVEFGNQVHIGSRRSGASGDRTMKAQVEYACRSQLRFVLPQSRDDEFPVHSRNVPHSLLTSKQAKCLRPFWLLQPVEKAAALGSAFDRQLEVPSN